MKNIINLILLFLVATTAYALTDLQKQDMERPNLVSNPGFEAGKGSYILYNDGAAALPVDGTGGTPNVTLTLNSSSPIAGSRDIILTKDAANRQGQGFAKQITIPSGYQGKTVEITQECKSSAAYADGDVIMSAYDITNSALVSVIQPTVYAWTGPGSLTFRSMMQIPATSASMRLIWHIATTNASAWTLECDSVRVGLPTVTNVSPVTGSVAWTPTGSWTTNVTYSGQKYRIADRGYYEVLVQTSGATDAASLTINLPAGEVIDSTKVKLNSAGTAIDLGECHILDSGTANYFGRIGYNNTTSVVVNAENSSGTYGTMGTIYNNVPMTWANNDGIVCRFNVPIVGWSGNAVVGQDASTSVIGATVARMSSTQTVTAGTPLEVIFNTTVTDQNSICNTTNGRCTAPISGLYTACYLLELTTGGSAPSDMSAYMLVNGTGNFQGYWATNAILSSKYYPVSQCQNIYLNQGQYVSVWVNSTGQNITVDKSANGYVTQFSLTRMSGPPGAVTIGDFVGARYSTNAGNTPTSGGTSIVDFEDKDFDSHGIVTTGASWKFTANKSMKVSVKAAIAFGNGAWVATNWAELYIYKNGFLVSLLDHQTIQANFTDSPSVSLKGSDDVTMNQGDYIDIRVAYSRTAGNLALSADGTRNRVSITEVK